ncbi:MAG: M1 family metallopeptidase [candidate division KSB1 bacterium]|nr:M1 family metallopeptidase [candidate division KSB1 bacterium]
MAALIVLSFSSIALTQNIQKAESWLRAEAERKEQRAKRLLTGAGTITDNQEKYDVHYYALKLDLDVAEEYLAGEMTVKAWALDSLHHIELNLLDEMRVDSVLDRGKRLSFGHVDDLIHVNLSAPVSPDSSFSLSVYYSGYPENGTRMHFGFDTYQNKPMIWSLSEPFGARTWWPCKDYPKDKADSVNIYITVPQDLIVASNGRLVKTTPLGEKRTFHWHEQYPIATYLVSVAIHPYINYQDWYITASGDSILLDYYVFAEHLSALKNNYAKTPEMMSVFSERFGEYPFPEEKYGHAEFLWGGGMEHQTISSLGYWGEILIAHELAHQWWGNMVTCENFHHIWLNEGFATYAEALWKEYLGGADAMRQWMNYKRYLGEGTVFVEDPLQDDIFHYELTYMKAGWVLHMLRHVVGETVFFELLHEYRERFYFKTAVTKDFQTVCEAVSGMDLEPFFQQWIYESGYPFYRYTWKTEKTSSGNYLLSIMIHQVQDDVVYQMPIDMQLQFTAGDSTIVLQNSKRSQAVRAHCI